MHINELTKSKMYNCDSKYKCTGILKVRRPTHSYSQFSVIPGHHIHHLRGTGTFSEEETLSNLFYLSSEKGSTLKGKNSLPTEAKFSF